MARYDNKKINFFNEKDEMGAKYSLVRLEGESVSSFEERVMYQCREESSIKMENSSSFLNNFLGFPEERMLEIERVKDSNGADVYPYSFLEIDSFYLTIVKDFFTGESIKLKYRELSAFSEIDSWINSSGVLVSKGIFGVDLTIEGEAYKLKCEKNLRYDEYIFTERKSIDIEVENIVEFNLELESGIYNEVDTINDIQELGDYYLNEKQGKACFYEETEGHIHYSYCEFPFFLKKQHIKISSCREESFNEIIKEEIQENGLTKRIKLNETGAKFYNEVFKSFCNHWDV